MTPAYRGSKLSTYCTVGLNRLLIGGFARRWLFKMGITGGFFIRVEGGLSRGLYVVSFLYVFTSLLFLKMLTRLTETLS